MYEDLAVQLTKELIRIESFSVKGKNEIIRYMYRQIRKETQTDVRIMGENTDHPYLIARYENGEGPPLLLQGHLDTVSPEGMESPLNPVVEAGEIYGRGSCDMKAGCAANFAAYKYACDHQIKGSVYLMYSTDEETFARQTIDAFQKGLLPYCDMGIIPEPTNGQLMTAQKGNAWIEVEVKGKSAHASMPELGINAIYMTCEFIRAFKDYTSKKYRKNAHPLLGEASMNVGMIKAGTEPNSVPDTCSIVIDKRYLPNETIQDFYEEIHTAAETVKKEYPDFEYAAKLIVDCTPMEMDRSSDKFIHLKTLLERALERYVDVGIFNGWGEGGTLSKYDIDTLYFGPGNQIYAHSAEERVGIEAIKEVTQGLIAVVDKQNI